MKNSNRFTLNFFEKTISGTKASFDKASKGISPIYEELTFKMNAHPTFTLLVKEPKHKSNKPKRTYDGMNYKFIENYIGIQRNAAVLMAEYRAVKASAEEHGVSVYPIVKKWFLGEFDPNGEGFDMEKAKMAISEHIIGAAVLDTPAPSVATEAREEAAIAELAKGA